MILPPKRYESPDDPKFDPIRHKPWFQKLLKRREKLPKLKAALDYANKNVCSQRELWEKFGVNPREYRDYSNYINGYTVYRHDDEALLQYVIDRAYEAYCADGARRPFSEYLTPHSKLCGRHRKWATTLWEVDSNLYPTGYKP